MMEVLEKKRVKIDKNNPSLQRIDARCIECGMCYRTCEDLVGINHEYEHPDRALCINCGACIMNCPVGALCTKFDYRRVLNILHDTDKRVAVSLAPAVRVALGAEFGIEDGTNLESIIPSILRRLGFDYVFDVTFGADVTIMEEASELLYRLEHKCNLPMFTSCCPSWVKYAGMFHPELLPSLSTTKSPIGIQSALIKTYFKELNAIDDDIVSVVVAPCTAKKMEIKGTDTDYVITTQELAMMMRECDIDIDELNKSEFDKMLSCSSKAGLLFGRSGGVMESILNCSYHFLSGKDPKENQFSIDLEGGITSKKFKLGSKTINVAVIYGMKNLETFLPNMNDYDMVEVMNCTLGCIGGGGQPLIPIQKIGESLNRRLDAMNSDSKDILYCYQNREVIDLYNSYIGSPLSDKAEKLLHTKHRDLSHLINEEK